MSEYKELREAVERVVMFARAFPEDFSGSKVGSVPVMQDIAKINNASRELIDSHAHLTKELAEAREALGKIDPLTQYSSGNPEAQLFAVQQIIRAFRKIDKIAGDV